MDCSLYTFSIRQSIGGVKGEQKNKNKNLTSNVLKALLTKKIRQTKNTHTHTQRSCVNLCHWCGWKLDAERFKSALKIIDTFDTMIQFI